MKKNRSVTFYLAAVIFLSALPAAHAAEGTTGDYFVDIGTKLWRGIWNVVSSPAELPCTISEDMHNNSSSGFFTGFGRGTALMARRMLVGISEVGTFVIPMEATIPPVCQKSPAKVS